ncbi:hypothetical protein ACFLSI_03650 [Bacteroidota bacterium]
MNIKNIIRIFIISLSALYLFSCDIINPSEDIPSYVRIDSLILKTKYLEQGSASHNLTDIWISIEGDKFGTFELPALIPILRTGETNIVIRPSYRVDDQVLVREPYAFTDPFIIDTILTEGSILHLKPIVYYNENAEFLFLEDFEKTGYSFTTNRSDTALIIVNNTFSDGEHSGGIFLSNTNPFFEAISPEMDIPKANTPIYLEFSYKNNYNFEVGFFANTIAYTYIAHLSPRDNWKRITININGLIKQNQDSNFKIAFRASLIDTISKPEIYLDNIKIIHF